MTQETESMGDFAWSAASVPRLFLSLDTTGRVLLTTSRAHASSGGAASATGSDVYRPASILSSK